jgi:hypothetical protein
MLVANADWVRRISELWADIDRYDADEFVDRVGALAALVKYLPHHNRSAR